MPGLNFSDEPKLFPAQWQKKALGALMGGLGLLGTSGVLLLGNRFYGLHPLDRLLIFLFGAGCLIWGVATIAREVWDARSRRPADLRRGKSPAGRSLWSFTHSSFWLGVGLLLLGAEFLVTMRWRTAQGVPAIVILFAAWFSIAIGLWQITRAVFPRFAAARLRQRVAISRQGYFYLIMMSVFFLGSLLGRSNMLMLVFSFMAGPFILNGWMTFWALRWIEVKRRMPTRAMAGEPFQIQFTLGNRRAVLTSSLMSVVDTITKDGQPLEAGVLFARVPPRSERNAAYTLQLMNRGRYTLGPVVVSTRFPLGMVERQYRFDLPGELIVYPRVGRLTPEWERDRSRDAEQSHLAQGVRGIFEDEFNAIREYRSGDNPRAIHWKTSARKNELMVREFQQHRGQNLLLLIDLWQPEQPGEDDLDRVELAVSFAATVAVSQLHQRHQSRVTVCLHGAELLLWDGDAGNGRTEQLLEKLALAEASSAADPGLLSLYGSRWQSPRTRSVMVTTRTRLEDAGGMIGLKTLQETLRDVQVLQARPEVLGRLAAYPPVSGSVFRS